MENIIQFPKYRKSLANKNYEYPSEQDECRYFMQWINLHKDLEMHTIHIPNEGRRSLQFGSQLRSIGMKKGVSDYFIAIPVEPFCGLWLEIKSTNPQSRVTKEQMSWLEKMHLKGYACALCFGKDSAIDVVKAYLKGNLLELT